jgi:hypothetical protein
LSRRKLWMVVYYLLFVTSLGTAGLNMLRVHGGFFTNYAADLVVPAWLYVASRGLHSPSGRTTRIQRTVGHTPEIAALTLFVASTLTEVSQHYWPHGLFPGQFDILDVVAYACGLAVCYAADKLLSGERGTAARVKRQPAA